MCHQSRKQLKFYSIFILVISSMWFIMLNYHASSQVIQTPSGLIEYASVGDARVRVHNIFYKL
jgi:hypothetical protein